VRSWLFGLGLVLGIAGPGHALVIDPTLSSVAAASGGSESLSGSLAIALGQVPVAANTTFDVIALQIETAGGTRIGLDLASASPGAGVVNPQGAFLIPTLFLRVEDAFGAFDLAVPNVEGVVELDATASLLRRLVTSFQIDSGGEAGVLTVAVVAVPEPHALVLVILAGLAAARARREES
jgi:hypothetical protein